MLNNHQYDLLNQLVEEHKSMWRLRNDYPKDADCDDCKALWEEMANTKENMIAKLLTEAKKHL